MKNKIYIFGAHSRAQTLAEYLRCLHPEITVAAYLYDNDEENPFRIGMIEVIRLSEGAVLPAELHTDVPVYIGTKGIYHQQIISHLQQMGFFRIYLVTAELDLQLRNKYMEKYFAEMGKDFLKIEMLEGNEPSKTDSAGRLDTDGVKAAIYMAVSACDKPLKQQYPRGIYEKQIQAGTALTDNRFPNSAADNEGDNISGKNRQFCELTALYWLWKHAGEEIIGLEHYRRRFLLPDDWAFIMLKNDIDVILPIPLYVAPNLAENYKNRHDASNWDYMMECLKKRDIQEYRAAETFFHKSIYSPCNMLIARRNVLNGLCEWLFPILFAAADYGGGEKEDSYQNRYPGFLSERLMSFYFEANRDKYKIVYADKNFLE